MIQERDSNNVPVVSYTRRTDLSGTLQGAGGIGGLLGRSSGYSGGSWTTHAYYHAAGNGNITYLVDASQILAASYRYDPYGNTVSSSGPLASANVYRFSSKEIHANSGMYYFLYRFYDPNLQRWTSRDPIEEEGGLNLYAVLLNAPTLYNDPWGLCGGGGTDPDLQQCFTKAIARYASSQNNRLWHAATKHMLWTTLSGVATAIGGAVAILTGGGAVFTPTGAVAEGAIAINDVILGGVLTHEAGKIAKEAKDRLKKDLDKCANDSGDPQAQKEADGIFARFNH